MFSGYIKLIFQGRKQICQCFHQHHTSTSHTGWECYRYLYCSKHPVVFPSTWKQIGDLVAKFYCSNIHYILWYFQVYVQDDACSKQIRGLASNLPIIQLRIATRCLRSLIINRPITLSTISTSAYLLLNVEALTHQLISLIFGTGDAL